MRCPKTVRIKLELFLGPIENYPSIFSLSPAQFPRVSQASNNLQEQWAPSRLNAMAEAHTKDGWLVGWSVAFLFGCLSQRHAGPQLCSGNACAPSAARAAQRCTQHFRPLRSASQGRCVSQEDSEQRIQIATSQFCWVPYFTIRPVPEWQVGGVLRLAGNGRNALLGKRMAPSHPICISPHWKRSTPDPIEIATGLGWPSLTGRRESELGPLPDMAFRPWRQLWPQAATVFDGVTKARTHDLISTK